MLKREPATTSSQGIRANDNIHLEGSPNFSFDEESNRL